MNPEDLETPTNQIETQKKSTWKSITKEIIIFVIIAFGVVLPFRLYVAEPYVVDGRSMDPTFSTGDYLIVDKLSYEVGEPKRNSVVVFKYPIDPSKSFIKRIVGLPGETVSILGGTVRIINKENPEGITLEQLYVTHTSSDSFQKTLEKDEYFVMGDNRAESFDSRIWGALPRKNILGKPILRLFPINKISLFPGKVE